MDSRQRDAFKSHRLASQLYESDEQVLNTS
jgi:hypothetical protein